MNLSYLSSKDTVASFLINDYDKDHFPLSGDSLRINPGAVKDNAGNMQSSEHNRRGPLFIKQGSFTIKIKAGPNPLNINENSSIKITASPIGKLPSGAKIDAKLVIFDNLGNCIIPETVMKVDPDKPAESSFYMYEWKGRNRQGRKVGTGTYIVFVRAKSEGTEATGRIKIGVRNSPVTEEKK